MVECGIDGRTTAFEEPFRDCRNGCSGLGYTLLENKPIDLLIISLGTNDTEIYPRLRVRKGPEKNSAYSDEFGIF